MRLHWIAAAAFLLLPLRGEEWSRFRGPNGSGVSADTGFPVEFGAGKNCVWRTPVRPGKSSPVLTERQIFLTGFEKGKLYTQCFDRASGKLLWERTVERAREEDVNKLNQPAAITPVTDGENIYVFFKDYGLISYDAAGGVRWKAPLGPFMSSMGLGASPILAGDAVVMLVDQREHSYIAAFDRHNGEIRWKTARDEAESWGTPLLFGERILTASRGFVGAHEAADGKRALTQDGISPTIVASPVLGGDTLFVFGYGSEAATPFRQTLDRYDKNHDGQVSPDEYGDNSVMVAIGRYIGNGDLMVTEKKWEAWQQAVVGPSRMVAMRIERGSANGEMHARELWRLDKSFVGVVPSALFYQGVVYVVKNGGILTSYEAATGKELKTGRVQGAIGGYSSSPVEAEGRLYLANEDGKVAVVRAGAEWEVVAVNDLGESVHATPALSKGRIYLRTGEALYCFGSTK